MELRLLTARALRAAGDDTRGLERGARSGRLLRLRPGVYVVATEWRDATAAQRHRGLVDACAATAVREPVFSHESAALLHGIPVIGGFPPIPQTIAPEPRPGSRHTRTLTATHRPRHPVEPTRVDGLLATGLIDTVVALAATRSLQAGVAAIDHALARGVTKESIAEIIQLRRPFHGARKALRAHEIATGLAESPLESISLADFALLRIPAPEQQVEVVARGRRFRLDFYWRDLGIAGEADGRGKYLSPDDVWREKQRQDALRAVGIRTARWDWDDALAVTPVRDRLLEVGFPVAPRSATYSL